MKQKKLTESKKAVVEIAKLNSKIRLLNKEIKKRNEIIEFQDNEIALHDHLHGHKFEQPCLIISGDNTENICTPIINIGDLHVESNIQPETVLGLNISNPEIIAKRMKFAAHKSLNMLNNISKEMKFNRILIQFMGDNITGYIHEELIKTNLLTPFQATLAAKDILISFIKDIADTRKEQIDVVCIIGNHSRNAKRKEYNVRHINSFEYWLYNEIIEYFTKAIGYNHVNIIFPVSEFAVIKIFDKTVTTSHGDHFMYMGGIGGLQIPMMRWDLQLQRTVPADKRYIGHWHTHYSSKRVVISASICGYDAFALGHKFEFEPPSINIDICHKDHGFIQNRLIVLPSYLNNE